MISISTIQALTHWETFQTRVELVPQVEVAHRACLLEIRICKYTTTCSTVNVSMMQFIKTRILTKI